MSKNEKILSNLLNFGINLDLKTNKENEYYAQCFTAWMMQQEDFDAHLASDKDIEVYYLAELVLMVKIENSTLTIEPVTESCFDAVLMILRFVSERHEDIMKEFTKLNTTVTSVDSNAEDDVEEESEEISEWI
tara:strand:- start:10 stop:408 length:399 start_codon:yes stop_codon:yes gene_type:complete